MQRSALCRSRRELSNEYLLAKIGVDTAENEPLEVWAEIQFNIINSCPYFSVKNVKGNDEVREIAGTPLPTRLHKQTVTKTLAGATSQTPCVNQ